VTDERRAWTYRFDRGSLVIDTRAMSNALWAAGERPVNVLARRGAAIAVRKVEPNGERFVGFKTAKRFPLQSRRIGSTLSQQLDVPVALIFNNSKWALEAEVGSLANINATPRRPLLTALKEVGALPGVSSKRAKDTDFEGMRAARTRSRASRMKGAKRKARAAR
jgi:hypothetical protein